MAFQGGTPAFALPLLAFNHLMDVWDGERAAGAQDVRGPPITVALAHAHVVALQERFLRLLPGAQHPVINTASLVLPCDAPTRSHTLVFAATNAAAAKEAAEQLARRGVLVDCRGAYVRIGFGLNNDVQGVTMLVAALERGAPF